MMKRASLGSLTFEKTEFEGIEKMIVAIFPDSKITKEKEDLFYRANLLGKEIGFLHLGKRKIGWKVIGIGVVPEYRDHGYGTEILRFGIDLVRRMLGHSLSLSVEENNLEAINIYSKLGFRKIGRSGE
ncbi:MAG: GNAT family N-acetyltransferase, partial [Candidatus Micrarchaeota archaeon]|nr:GNAT family N-acetyltransferase [Candidatus Micrarchaeota archaeon]